MSLPLDLFCPDLLDILKSGATATSAYAAHCKFFTVVNPYESKIMLSQEFWEKEKEHLLSNAHAILRDPVCNYFRVRIIEEGHHGFLCGGKVIAKHCGFDQPQRVFMQFLGLDNHFEIKPVDEHGNDVLYLGFRYPINHHDAKASDPSYDFRRVFVKIIQDGDVVVDPNVVELNDVYDEVVRTWEVFVGKSMAKRKRVLFFPIDLGVKYLNINQQTITLVDNLTDKHYECNILRDENTSNPTPYIADSFYQFVRDAKLKYGDKLVCTISMPPQFLEVTVIRRGAHNN